MSFLMLTIGDSDIPGELTTDGTCNKHHLAKVSFDQILAIELYARLQGEALLPTLQELFETLGTYGNGKAALEALVIIHKIMVPSEGKYPHHYSLTPEEFEKRQRGEYKAFLDWLLPIFWKLRLYGLYRDSTHGGPTYLRYGNPLKELKQWVVAQVAQIWSGECDAVGRKAFRFLSACVDSKKFFALAKNLESKKMFSAISSHDKLSLEPEDIKVAMEEMRKALPKDEETIILWLKYAYRTQASWEMRKFLGNAFVNAGGVIPLR